MKIVVTGATGDVGRHVVRFLRGRGVQVRAFVRDPPRAAGVLGGNVELAAGDFADADSVRAAVAGAGRVFLACGNVPDQVDYETGVIRAAAEAGVERLVKISALGAEIGSPLAFWDWHGRIESELTGSGIPSVILRPTSYMTKILGPPEPIKQTGKIFAPAGDARVSFIDPADVGAAAAAVLTEDGHDGQTWTLSGPEALSFTEVAAALSQATGRQIEYVDVPEEAARQGMVAAGMPQWLADNVVTLFGLVRQGVASGVTSAVQDLTGRSPRSFREFFADNAQLFR